MSISPPHGMSHDHLIQLRRHLHMHPELSTQEHQTAATIAQRLRDLGLEPQIGQHGADTGVVALLEGEGGPGPTFAWRADTDALPILEENDAAYCSTRPGVMHACGHDVHTTIGLGVAAYLSDQRKNLRGRVKFIFQPAEEGSPGDGVVGAEAMARAGVLTNPDVDAAFAIHCMPSLPVGTLGFNPDAMWAGSDLFKLRVCGTSTHGAYPQDGVDPIFVAAQLIVALQGLPGRVIDTRDACVVSVGQLQAGTAFNIIPPYADLVGIVRTLDEAVRERALDAMRRLVEHTCAAWGASAELTFHRGAFVTANDPALVRDAVQALQKTLPPEALLHVKPQLGAEDFASFSRRVPSAYLLLGVGNPQRGITHPIHSPRFDVDEACLPFAVHHLSQLLLSLAASRAAG